MTILKPLCLFLLLLALSTCIKFQEFITKREACYGEQLMEGLKYKIKVEADNPDFIINIYENDLGKLYKVMNERNDNKQMGKVIETSTNKKKFSMTIIPDKDIMIHLCINSLVPQNYHIVMHGNEKVKYSQLETATEKLSQQMGQLKKEEETVAKENKLIGQNEDVGWYVVVLSCGTMALMLLMACCQMRYMKNFFIKKKLI